MLTFFIGLLAASSACGQDLPAEVSTALILKALTYDRSLDQRFSEELRIGILHTAATSEAEYARNFDAIMKKAAVQFAIGSLKIKSHLLEYTASPDDHAAISKMLQDNRISILVVVSDNRQLLGTISSITRELKINSICTSQQCVHGGIAFGVLLEEEKPTMYVNLTSIEAEGSDYSGKFLSLCNKVD